MKRFILLLSGFILMIFSASAFQTFDEDIGLSEIKEVKYHYINSFGVPALEKEISIDHYFLVPDVLVIDCKASYQLTNDLKLLHKKPQLNCFTKQEINCSFE